MKVICAGSRSITDYEIIKKAIAESNFEITEIVSGGARGVDRLGERYAVENGILWVSFPANWDKHGKSAGYKRNVQMAEYAEAAIVIWDGVSKGSQHMINIAKEKGLKVFTWLVKK